MPFDPTCKVYWCDVDGCGGEMTLDCGRSSDEVVMLSCGRCPASRLFFSAADKQNCGKEIWIGLAESEVPHSD